MPELSLKEMYPTPWGIVESRRNEIESGAYGAFERIMREEIEKLFMPIGKVAEHMKARQSTARKWLNENDPRFVIIEGVIYYHREDAEKIAEHRASTKAKKKAKDAKSN